MLGVAITKLASIFPKIEPSIARTAIITLALKLLDATRPHFRNWVKAGFVFSKHANQGRMYEWVVAPGCESCLTLVYLCYFELFEAAEYFVENLSGPVLFETEIEVLLSHEFWKEVVDARYWIETAIKKTNDTGDGESQVPVRTYDYRARQGVDLR
jgi:hypothetical protein